MKPKTEDERIAAVQKALSDNNCTVLISPVLNTPSIMLDLSDAFDKANISYRVTIHANEEPKGEETQITKPKNKNKGGKK